MERAILAGDFETGVCIMRVEATLDTGPICAMASVPIGEKGADELTGELAVLGAELLIRVLGERDVLENPQGQKGEATYAEKLTEEASPASHDERRRD